MVKKYEKAIVCADGYRLTSTVYEPTSTLRGAVMIAPATGIKQIFYNSFASYLSENGYGVICFDNRGIGKSIDSDASGQELSLIAWGRQDMSAVLEELKRTFPRTDHHLVGHSAGGQLIGLMDNHRDIKSVFNFACSSGSIRNMPYPFKLQAIFFLRVFIPFSNLCFGRANSQWVGMGEPLPKKVAAQWSRWCNGSGYIATDFGKAVKTHHYEEISIPSEWVHATDDGIANLANVKDMIRVFPNIQVRIRTLKPEEWGYEEIGHMKFFSSKCKALWPMALDFLKTH